MAALVGGRRWGSIAFRMIFFLPFILAEIATGLIFHYIFDGDVGIVSVGQPMVRWPAGRSSGRSELAIVGISWPRPGSISAST